jgi:hypothetical protein
MMPLNRTARGVFISVFLLGAIDVNASEQPELVEQKPEYTRTRELPALKISFADMQSILEKAANLLSDANVNPPRKKEFFFRETLMLGKEPDQIEIAGHSFPANARLPKAAYPLSYFYSWTDAPVSKLELVLRDSWSRLTVRGTAVDQVEAICAALERDLLQHAAPAQQPGLVEQKPEYTRTRDLPALKMSFTDMQFVLDKAAHLLADANREAKESSPHENLTLGTGPEEIKIEDHNFPAKARLPKAAYAVSYLYLCNNAPVSTLQLTLGEYTRRLGVSGTAVDQVEAISAALERDLSQYSAIGGPLLRDFVRVFLPVILFLIFIYTAAYCIFERRWRNLGMPIFSLIGIALILALPLKDLLAGFAMYQGEASSLVRYGPQIGFASLILAIAAIPLSFFIPKWLDAAKKEGKPSSSG